MIIVIIFFRTDTLIWSKRQKFLLQRRSMYTIYTSTSSGSIMLGSLILLILLGRLFLHLPVPPIFTPSLQHYFVFVFLVTLAFCSKIRQFDLQ